MKVAGAAGKRAAAQGTVINYIYGVVLRLEGGRAFLISHSVPWLTELRLGRLWRLIQKLVVEFHNCAACWACGEGILHRLQP